MLTYALDFFNRFPRKDDSRMQVLIATVNKGTSDKTADQIKATMEAAYRVMYGDKGMLEFVTVKERPNSPRNIFGRMFETTHLHVAVSSRVLHVLSKEPEEVVENGWNKTKVWIEGSEREVVRAYAEQADKDLVEFLTCRREELKIGGSLFMLIDGRPSGSDSQLGDDNDMNRKHPLNTYMDRAWQDLVDTEQVTVEERDRFNIPIYFRSQEEVKAAIDRCGGFKMENMVNLKIADEMNTQKTMWVDSPALYGKHRALMVRAAVGNFIEAYLDKDKIAESDKIDKIAEGEETEDEYSRTDVLFEQYASIAANDTELINKACFTQVIAVSVTRTC
ncbi:SAM dependent carboxyl methyltransferase [Arabidopsis suecica]|uniref:SAM dependent carboxyl methyltransferase n=1 Tax=Arabidopsis suecica TaxID=45249 RepID=A0A8T1YJB9_ARASU|nr:SAM dependent carboxyl methyltransferase [Arabidopsis suecica]